MDTRANRFDQEFDVELAALHGDATEVKEYTRNYASLLVELYRTQKHREIKKEIIYQDRQLDWLVQKYNADQDIGYSIGYLSGIICALKEFVSKAFLDERMNKIMENLDTVQLPHFDEILYTIEKEEGIRHGKLAERIGVDKSTLSGIMDKAILSGAVNFSRPGKFKYYYLSTAGKAYCSDKRKRHKSVRNIDSLIEEIALLLNQEKDPAEAVAKIVKALYEKNQKVCNQAEDTVAKQTSLLEAVNQVSALDTFKMKVSGKIENYTINSALAVTSPQHIEDYLLIVADRKTEEMITNSTKGGARYVG